MLVLDEEVVEFLLLWELIAQAHSVVVDAEADGDMPLGGILQQVDGQFVVMVADGGRLAPHGFPGLVEGAGLRVGHREAIHQVGLIIALVGMLVLGQFQSEPAGTHHVLPLV